MTVDKRPLGIRLNNPGCLRRACAPDSKLQYEAGYAKFDTFNEGIINLAWCIWNYYHHLKLTTPKLFVCRYAPPSENDTLRYIEFVSRWLFPTIIDGSHDDMHLDEASRAVMMMQALCTFECGWRKNTGVTLEKWIDTSAAFYACAMVGKFK